MKNILYRQDVIEALICADENIGKNTCIGIIKRLPSARQEYEPVTAEEVAQTMSTRTIYDFMTCHRSTLTLIWELNEMGFVICKKTI